MEDSSVRKPATRLHVSGPLAENATVALDTARVHFLKDVLRLRPGDPVAVFDCLTGEWHATIATLAKQAGSLAVGRQIRPQAIEPDLWLLFAPVKHLRIDYLVEKATELGVSALIPVVTQRTVVGRVNLDRLEAHAREAAEQSERLSVPAVRAPIRLSDILDHFPPTRRLFLCDETGAASPFAEVLAGLGPMTGGAAVMLGPEGGFAPAELDFLRQLPFVTAVSLGPRVLRADTAALAALSVFQALAGDWSRRRDPP